MHPLVNDFSKFKDSELEERAGDLTRKYFQTNNMELKGQISMILESYKEELTRRRQANLEKMMATRDKSLDKLIKVQ